MRQRTLIAAALGAALWYACAGAPAEARNLRNTLGAPTAAQGGVLQAALAPLGSVIGSQITNQIPTLSTSAGYTYEYNPELEVYERSTKTFGPLFSERAVTIGKGKFNINLSYTYIRFDSFNGRSLDHLTSRVEQAIDPTVNRPAFAGLRRTDLDEQFPDPPINDSTRFTQLKLDLDLEAQLVDFSFTYGVLEDLDVNIDVPVLRTFARSTVTERTLDPRFEEAINRTFSPVVDQFAAREDALGIGDIRLRSKYLAYATGPVRFAGLLDLILPTGSPGNFQGTGDTRLGVFLISSGTFLDVFEPHAQAGVEFNCADVDISQAKYLAGVTAQVASFAAITVDFLGRSEFGPLGRIPSTARLPAVSNGEFTENAATSAGQGFHGRPILVDINRNDILDLAIGGKIALGPRAIFFLTATLPLNNDGLRASVVPTAGFEATF